MENHIIDTILTVLGIAGTGIIGYIARAVVKYIVRKHIEALALQAVHYDAFKTLKGEAKFAHACEWASKMLKRYHIKIDEEEIEGAGHAAYTIFVQAAEKEFVKAKYVIKSPQPIWLRAFFLLCLLIALLSI